MWHVHHCTLENSVKKRYADCLCRFTLDLISQIDLNISIALATIRQWKNSFTLVNRIPTDILSLIPTHPKGPFPCRFCVPSLAWSPPQTRCAMVTTFSQKRRGVCVDPPRTRKRVCTGYDRPFHCSCWYHNTDCLSRPANCIPRIRGKLLEGHYSVL